MTRKRHHNPNRIEHNREANPKRNTNRLNARVAYLLKLKREREIGPDPFYDHSRGRNETERAALRAEWLKKAAQKETQSDLG